MENEFKNLNLEQKEKINLFKSLIRWLTVDVTIRVFGVVVFNFHYPPKKS